MSCCANSRGRNDRRRTDALVENWHSQQNFLKLYGLYGRLVCDRRGVSMLAPRSTVLTARQRASRYFFVDGFSTLIAGLGCLLMAFQLFYSSDGRTTPFSLLVSLPLLLAYLAVMFRQREIVEWLKTRITYPRTGFAIPPGFEDDSVVHADLALLTLDETESNWLSEVRQVHADRKRRMLFTIVAVLLAILGIMLIPNRWFYVASGILISAGLWIATRREQVFSWLVLAGFPLVGIGMATFLPDRVVGPDRGADLLATAGSLFFLDGVLTLIRYLRRNPLPKQTQS